MRTDFKTLDFEITGESHSKEMRLKIFNMPKGLPIDINLIDEFISKRVKAYKGITERIEKDRYEIVSGIADGVTTGKLIEIIAYNEDAHPDAYDLNVLRPSHADYVALLKDGKIKSGGGRFSGRLTLMLCIMGGIAASILNAEGIYSYSFISNIAGISFVDIKNTRPMRNVVQDRLTKIYPFYESTESNQKKLDSLLNNINGTDSVGGIIQSAVFLEDYKGKFGDALFEGLESKLAYYIYSIPAVKGVEFGDGFQFVNGFGSDKNDKIRVENNNIVIQTNHTGGIDGGIANGNPIIISTAVKPTPTISIEQETVNISTMKNVTHSFTGRYDSCIAMRIPICIDSAIYIALLDEYFKRKKAIPELRAQIDSIDDELMQLLDRRFDIVKEIGKVKIDEEREVLDSTRESDIKYKILLTKHCTSIDKIYNSIFKESRRLQ